MSKDMKNMTLDKIAEAVGGQLYIGGKKADILPANRSDEKVNGAQTAKLCETEALCVVIDSRLITENGIFIATKGERADGHDYIGQVFEKGALGVICERLPKDCDKPCILVEDSFAALRALAEYYRNQLSVKIVGIIGSVGKTSTKELVAAVLSAHYNVLKTEGNFNNEIGVPLTILRIRKEHEVAVVEMGINHFGEMHRLAQIVRPDAVVMTNIGPCHLEFLGDLDGVLRAKSEVFEHMCDGSVRVLNSDDERLGKIASDKKLKSVFYGVNSQEADVKAVAIESLGLAGSNVTMTLCGGNTIEAFVPLPGRHMVDNALAAAAIGEEWGLTAEEIIRGMKEAKTLAGRANIIRTDSLTIVDDCYNANPKSMKASIDMMKDANGRKVAILGDMFELGEDGDRLHAEVGEYAINAGIDVLICVGEASANMYEAARDGNDVRYYPTRDDLMAALSENSAGILRKGDSCLVKSSHGMGFALVVEELKKVVL